MGPNGMDLGDDPNRRPRLSCRKSGALAGEASPNDQYVVLRHAARSLFRPGRALGAARRANDGH